MKKKNFIQNALITIYILLVLTFSATARAQMGIKPIFTDYKPAATQTFVGNIAMTPNQEFYLVVSEEEVYQLAANIDLTEYNGQEVEIEGMKITHKTGPAPLALSLDPLPGSEQAEAAPVLVVLGISGVVE